MANSIAVVLSRKSHNSMFTHDCNESSDYYSNHLSAMIIVNWTLYPFTRVDVEYPLHKLNVFEGSQSVLYDDTPPITLERKGPLQSTKGSCTKFFTA
jgi:hypothetical protein